MPTTKHDEKEHLVTHVPQNEKDRLVTHIHEKLDKPTESGKFPFQPLVEDFGWKFVALICCAQHVSKGFVGGFIGPASSYIFKQYKTSAPRVSTLSGVARLPWALKPLIGVLSDCFPIFGYARLPYFLLAATFGVVSLVVLSIFRTQLTVEMYVMLLFCNALYASCIDLLSEAVYAKELRNNPSRGPSLLALVWGGMTLASMAATLLSGVLLTRGSPWDLYKFACVPAAFILIPVMLNWQGESWLCSAEVQKRRERLWAQKETLALSFVLVVSTLTLSWSGLHLDADSNAIISAVVALSVLLCFSVLLNPVIAKVNAFSLIQTSLSLSSGGAGFYFMMDSPVQYPEGPHFTVTFYNIVLPLTGSIFSLLGIYIYNRQAGIWTYQKMYIIGNLIGSFLALFDIVFFKRLNVKWGVSDHVFVLGSSCLSSVIMEWAWMPSVVLLSQLCPSGIEAIMYANLAGCHNIGATISANFTALLLRYLDVTPNGSDNETLKFQNLWYVSLISTVLPLLPVVFVPWFIPNKLNNERVFDRDDVAVNEGSLFRRWFGYE